MENLETATDNTEEPLAERARKLLTPRIYVASLSDYNAGRLHGRWFDATRDAAELQAGVQAMLAASPDVTAEEFAIHDYEGFGSWRIHEYEALETVAGIARGIAEQGTVYGDLAALIGADSLLADPERYQESFLGHWESLDAFVHEMAADMGWEEQLESLPPSLQPYVHLDYDLMARDVQIELAVVDDGHGVTVFDPRLW